MPGVTSGRVRATGAHQRARGPRAPLGLPFQLAEQRGPSPRQRRVLGHPDQRHAPRPPPGPAATPARTRGCASPAAGRRRPGPLRPGRMPTRIRRSGRHSAQSRSTLTSTGVPAATGAPDCGQRRLFLPETQQVGLDGSGFLHDAAPLLPAGVGLSGSRRPADSGRRRPAPDLRRPPRRRPGAGQATAAARPTTRRTPARGRPGPEGRPHRR